MGWERQDGPLQSEREALSLLLWDPFLTMPPGPWRCGERGVEVQLPLCSYHSSRCVFAVCSQLSQGSPHRHHHKLGGGNCLKPDYQLRGQGMKAIRGHNR